MAKNVTQKAAKSVVWTMLQRFASMGIQFISGIVLARLLMPSDYGIIGMLSIFMIIARSCLDGGFGSALVQKKRPTQEDYSTIFWWNLGMSILLYVILFVSAPYIAKFYHMDILCKVLRVQAVVLFISALTMVQTNQLRKQFKFQKIALVTIVSSAIALAITIYMAYMGYGVWALVTQHILVTLLPSIVYWFTNKWRPSLVFSKSSFKELFSFGVYMFMTNILNDICMNIQGLLIGRIYSASTMGYYSKARHTENLASGTVSQALRQVTLPLYAEFQDNKEGLINIIKKITGLITYVSAPLMLLLILIAKPVFTLLYSDRWLESVPYFQVLCVAGVAVCLQSVNLKAIAAIGKSKEMFNWTIFKRILGLVLVVGGLWLGEMKGLLVGMVIQSWMIYLVNAYLVSIHIGYRLRTQLRDLMPVFVLSAVVCVLTWGVSYCCGLSMYWDCALKVVVYTVCYVGFSHIFHFDGYLYVKQLFIKMLKKVRKK